LYELVKEEVKIVSGVEKAEDAVEIKKISPSIFILKKILFL